MASLRSKRFIGVSAQNVLAARKLGREQKKKEGGGGEGEEKKETPIFT